MTKNSINKFVCGLTSLLIMAGCVPQNNQSSSNKKSNASNLNSSFNFSSGSGSGNTNSGSGSGSSSGSGTGTGSGSGTSDVVVPTPTPTTEYCGTLYYSKSNLAILIDDNGDYFLVDAKTYNAQQVIKNMVFPNDANQACLFVSSTKNTTFIRTHVTEYIQLGEPVVHPERETKKNQYSYELCGKVLFKTDPGQTTPWMQVQKVDGGYVIVTDNNNMVKNYLNANGSTNGCLYNNEGFTNNFSVTFKKYFKPTVIDFGW